MAERIQLSQGLITTCEILIDTLRFAIQYKTADGKDLITLDNALRTVAAISAIISEHPEHRAALIDLISADNAVNVLLEFATHEPAQYYVGPPHTKSETCQSLFGQTKMQLYRRLTNLLLSLALHSPPRSGNMTAILNLLLEKQMDLYKFSNPIMCSNSF